MVVNLNVHHYPISSNNNETLTMRVVIGNKYLLRVKQNNLYCQRIKIQCRM